MTQVISEMEKSWNEKIVFSVTEFRGKEYADLRIYYEDDEGDWKPTKKGLNIALDRFSEFKENLDKLEGFLREKGHLSTD